MDYLVSGKWEWKWSKTQLGDTVIYSDALEFISNLSDVMKKVSCEIWKERQLNVVSCYCSVSLLKTLQLVMGVPRRKDERSHEEKMCIHNAKAHSLQAWKNYQCCGRSRCMHCKLWLQLYRNSQRACADSAAVTFVSVRFAALRSESQTMLRCTTGASVGWHQNGRRHVHTWTSCSVTADGAGVNPA